MKIIVKINFLYYIKMSENNKYTLVLRSNNLSQAINSGTITNATYRVLWQQFLPSKYRKFKIHCGFKSIPTTTFMNSKSVVVNATFGGNSSYDTYNQGRTFVLGTAEQIISYTGVQYQNYYIIRDPDSATITIDNPNESAINITLTNFDGTVLNATTEFPANYILIITFEPVEEK